MREVWAEWLLFARELWIIEKGAVVLIVDVLLLQIHHKSSYGGDALGGGSFALNQRLPV